MTDQATPEGAVAPVETTPTPAPEGAKPEAGQEPAPPAKPESDEPRGVAKRIKELTDQRRAAEAREERLAKLLEETLRARQAEPPRTADPGKAKTLKDFNYDDNAYRDAIYKDAREMAEKAARDAGERFRVEQDAISRRAKFDERIDAFAKTVDDFGDVVLWKGDPRGETPVSDSMADFLMDSEEAGPLMYYLGNNPDEAAKIYRMSPAKAGRELQKLEDRLLAERAKAAQKPVSNAPPPTPKLEAADPGKSLKSTDPEALKLSGDEWKKLREKELAAARKRKAN